ncbi:MAG: hypothetical protein ACXABO_11915 [Promethearchaeota archaeon]|jgi:hypothetical protein
MGLEIETKPEKRETIQYYDIFFGLSNTFAMSFMVLLIPKYLFLVIIAHIFIILLIAGIIHTFAINNPFYTFFVFSAIIGGSFYVLPGILIIPFGGFINGIFDYIIFGIGLLEIFYIVIRSKDSTFIENMSRMSTIRSRAQYDPSIHYVLTDPKILESYREQALADELKEIQKVKDFYKKNKRDWIISISIISVIVFYICYFSSIFF